VSREIELVAKFLLGEVALDGVWFGDKHPTENGNFWWRKHLRAALSEQSAPGQEALPPLPDQLRADIAGLVLAAIEGDGEPHEVLQAIENQIRKYGQLCRASAPPVQQVVQQEGGVTVMPNEPSLEHFKVLVCWVRPEEAQKFYRALLGASK